MLEGCGKNKHDEKTIKRRGCHKQGHVEAEDHYGVKRNNCTMEDRKHNKNIS